VTLAIGIGQRVNRRQGRRFTRFGGAVCSPLLRRRAVLRTDLEATIEPSAPHSTRSPISSYYSWGLSKRGVEYEAIFPELN
jgi:hypothetical protein